MRALPSLRICLLVLATLSMHNVLAGVAGSATVVKSCLDAACVDNSVPVAFDIGISTLFDPGLQGLLSDGETLSVSMQTIGTEQVTIFEELDLSLWAKPTFSAESAFWMDPVVNCLAIGGVLSRCTAVFDSIDSSGRLTLENFVVSNTVVPIPAAAWLFGSGLLGLISIARKKAA